MLRSILSVLAGYGVVMVLTMGFFAVLTVLFPDTFSVENEGTLPSTPWLLGILGFGLLSAVASGYVTAFLARRSPFKHVLALAGVFLAMNLVYLGSVGQGQPLWYSLGLGLVGVAGVLLGGRFWIVKTLRSPAA